MKKGKMTWDDVTFKQFMKLQELLKNEDETERLFTVSELLLGEDVTNLPLAEYMQRVKVLDFIKEPLPENNLPKNIEVNGRKYHMDCLLGNIKTGQYVDYINHAKANDTQKLIAVFMIPEGHTYNDGYDMEQVFADVDDLPISIVNSVAFFFKRQFGTFMRIFQRYSIRQVKNTNMNKGMKKAAIQVVNKAMDLVLSPIS